MILPMQKIRRNYAAADAVTLVLLSLVLDIQQLDVEDKGRVGWNTWQLLGSIGSLRWDSKTTLTTNLHAEDTCVPTLNDLLDTESEGEWLS